MVTSQLSSLRSPPRLLEIVFRADASSKIGTGHVLRCLGLAAELQARGHKILFVCRSDPGHLIDLLRERGYDCVNLPAGITASNDAELTSAAISRLARPVDWLIVDHYGLDADWEASLRPFIKRLFALDDLADRRHDADIVLDSTHDETAMQLYQRLVPEGARLLLGPSYVQLRREFFAHGQKPRQPGPARRILVTFGGSDLFNTTGLTLQALDHPDFSSIAIDVLTGVSNPNLHAIRQQIQAIPNVTIHVQHPQPSTLMEQADLCVGACGTTTWERCYLGLPSLIVVLADNQRELAETLHRSGAVRAIGSVKSLTVEGLRKAIQSAIQDNEWRMQSSQAGQKLVDGRGVERAIQAIEQTG